MGVTIYYRGRLNDVRELGTFIDEIEEFAQPLGWWSQRCNGDWSKPNTARVSLGRGRVNISGHLPLQGITILPHENSEALWLTFDARGYLADPAATSLVNEGTKKPAKTWVSIKTQFAPPRIHAAVAKLLRYVNNRYISDLEVHDDGGY